jgi:hypothetical protein
MRPIPGSDAIYLRVIWPSTPAGVLEDGIVSASDRGMQ